MGAETPNLTPRAHDAHGVAEQHFAATYAPQRSLGFFSSIAGFVAVLWATSLFAVVQRFLRVTPAQLGVALGVQILAIGVATVAARFGGVLGRPHRVAERAETAISAAVAAALICLSGSATSFFWFLTIAHVVHNSSDALSARFMFRAHALALAGAAAVFAVQGQHADAVMVAFAAGVVLLSGSARGNSLWAQMQLEAERNRLQSELERALVQRERQRISRDLHDGPASHLAAVAWGVDALALSPMPDPEQLRAQLREIASRARQGMTDLRDVAQGLVREDTSMQALARALEHGSALSAECRLEISCDGDAALRPGVFEQLLLAGREALLNVARHAAASEVHVSLTLDQQVLELAVRDNGRGLPDGVLSRASGGLTHLRSRAESLGATLSILGERGTRIHLRLPRPLALSPTND